MRYREPAYLTILNISSDVFSMAPKPEIAMIPRQKRPIIFPKAAYVALRHPCNAEFVIINRTAGPGVAVATNTNAK